MQYLLSVIDDATGSATESEIAAITDFDDRLVADGHRVLAAALASPAAARVVDGRGHRPVVTDGPFVESTENVAGFCIIDASDPDTALDLATEASRNCRRRVEVRPFL